MSEPTARELLKALHKVPSFRAATVRADVLAARVEAVLALHARVLGDPDECSSCGYLVDWPCPTVRLLDGEEP